MLCDSSWVPPGGPSYKTSLGHPNTPWILFSLKFPKPRLNHAFFCCWTRSRSITQPTEVCAPLTRQATYVLQRELSNTGWFLVLEASTTGWAAQRSHSRCLSRVLCTTHPSSWAQHHDFHASKHPRSNLPHSPPRFWPPAQFLRLPHILVE